MIKKLGLLQKAGVRCIRVYDKKRKGIKSFPCPLHVRNGIATLKKYQGKFRLNIRKIFLTARGLK